jgi:hypothetical protein
VIDEGAIGERYRALAGNLDERRRRLWAAAEPARTDGGIAAVARASGISVVLRTIRARLLGHNLSSRPSRLFLTLAEMTAGAFDALRALVFPRGNPQAAPGTVGEETLAIL